MAERGLDLLVVKGLEEKSIAPATTKALDASEGFLPRVRTVFVPCVTTKSVFPVQCVSVGAGHSKPLPCIAEELVEAVCSETVLFTLYPLQTTLSGAKAAMTICGGRKNSLLGIEPSLSKC